MTTSNVEHPLSAEYPRVVARAEWLAARKALLAKEKELTRYRDTVNAERRRLPMVRIDKEYLFDGPDGKPSLLELFEGHRQLVVYHFMFDPSWDEGCPNCSFLVDNVGHLGHLHARDSDKAEVLLKGEAYFTQGESHGLSVFLRGDDSVFHTYSTYARGTDLLAGTYNYVDLTPMGRQEDWRSHRGAATAPSWRGSVTTTDMRIARRPRHPVAAQPRLTREHASWRRLFDMTTHALRTTSRG